MNYLVCERLITRL